MESSLLEKEVLPELKRILVLGNGGRENSLCWALQKCEGIEKVFISPGNGGSHLIQGCTQLEINELDANGLIKACKNQLIDLVVIGPEGPLAAGIADQLREEEITVFGPNADGAKLEASKSWAKQLMEQSGIPTAQYWESDSEQEALQVLNKVKKPLVVKADGLAAGKGVAVPESIEATKKAIHEVFKGKFGEAGSKIVLEEKLEGPEVSVFAISDGQRLVLLPSAQDHKRLKEGDQGPNTGGMGAYAPAPILNKSTLDKIKNLILLPTLWALQKKGIEYRGVIYAGLMLTKSGPKVIEFNCRFGDPECQTLMPLLGPELAHILYASALGCLHKAPNLSISKRCSACIVASSKGYPESPKIGQLITSSFKEKKTAQLFHASTKCTEDGKLVTSGGRVLAIVAQGENFDIAFNEAYNEMNKVYFEGIHYRNDIGNQVRTS